MAAYAASASAHSARPPTAEAQAEASTAEPKEKKDDEKRLPGDKKSYKMPQRREASEMRSSMPDPNLAKLAAQRSAKMVAGVQMGCSLSVTGKIKAISLSLQKWPAVGTTTSSNSISIGSKNWKASFGNSVAKSTKGPRRAWKSIAPRMERSPSLRPSVEAMYSSNETKKVRILAFFSEPRDAAHVRTRSTNFKAVLGLLLSRREATATAVLGHSGAKGSPFSSESLAMMFNEAASLMVRRCGQPSPCLSSSSMFSASSSPSPSPSLSSPSPLSSLSPLSPSSSSSTTNWTRRLLDGEEAAAAVGEVSGVLLLFVVVLLALLLEAGASRSPDQLLGRAYGRVAEVASSPDEDDTGGNSIDWSPRLEDAADIISTAPKKASCPWRVGSRSSRPEEPASRLLAALPRPFSVLSFQTDRDF
mmetsp:Transcript_85217/g.178089  ORF Transcript_85217/g.178089 Transcript_85217/m.178089 type:complete len:418 (+) Transcript_85217:843-2096(+)